MPFMIGEAPIRRTLKYLERCKVFFRENVKIFSVNYNNAGDHHKGARDFVFWHLQPIQYKNPNVQCITFENMTPSPFLRIFCEGGKNYLIDIDSRNKEDILDHLENFTAICKNKKEIEEMSKTSQNILKPCYMGYGCERHCICEFLGQIPCPTLVKLPNHWRGIPDKNPKYRLPPYYMELGLEDDEAESEE